jgi:hypothetical protein
MGHFDWPVTENILNPTTPPLPPKIETTCFYTILHKHIKPYV